MPPAGFAADPRDGDRIWLADATGLHRSTDGGRTFTRRHDEALGAVALDPDDPDRLIAGGARLYVSEDGGATLRPAFYADLELAVEDVVFDPVAPGVAYAAAACSSASGLPRGGRGVLRTTDGGRTWSSFAQGLDDLCVHALAITADGRDAVRRHGAGRGAENGAALGLGRVEQLAEPHAAEPPLFPVALAVGVQRVEHREAADGGHRVLDQPLEVGGVGGVREEPAGQRERLRGPACARPRAVATAALRRCARRSRGPRRPGKAGSRNATTGGPSAASVRSGPGSSASPAASSSSSRRWASASTAAATSAVRVWK